MGRCTVPDLSRRDVKKKDLTPPSRALSPADAAVVIWLALLVQLRALPAGECQPDPASGSTGNGALGDTEASGRGEPVHGGRFPGLALLVVY